MAADADDGESTDRTIGADSSLADGANPFDRSLEWVVLEGNRLVVATVFVLVVFLATLVLETTGVISFTSPSSMTRVASGLIAGTFSLVTVVVSINQLILSREFVAAGTAEDRLEGVESVRTDIADLADVPAAPAAPAALLEVLAETMNRRAVALESAVGSGDASVKTPVQRYAVEVQRDTARLDDALDATSFDAFDTLSLAARFDDDWYRYAGEHLLNAHEESLEPGATAALEDVRSALRLFAVAREHFKTTYLQRELTRFSQLTIGFGVPSILAAVFLGVTYADAAGPTLSYTALPAVVSVIVTIAIAPVALLAAYILRTATITRRTASTGPMLPTKAAEEGPFDVTDSEDGRVSVSDGDRL
ncbi:AP-2 family transcription factor [Halovivax cerinus]|uniref:Archaeal flagella assembly protein J n=1 Tax=Halovivax cerinus TaxID=1487865 RepID=A0ABD5NIS9_9EURY|nr:AP-2 family transcription factor [Halovivax cerinus]